MSRARSKLNPGRRAPTASRWPTRPLTHQPSRAVVAAILLAQDHPLRSRCLLSTRRACRTSSGLHPAPQLTIGQVVGVGHDQMLATPAQSVAMIQRFLYTALGRRPANNLAPVQQLFDAIRSGDLGMIDTLVSDDFVDHGAPPGTVPPGRRATRRRCDCYARPCR